jgi:hypothetical protein
LNRYLVPSTAVGSTLKVTVTGSNARGTGSTSVLSGVVDAVAPMNLALPSVSGRTAVGGTLTVSPGRWGGTFPQTVTYEWRMGYVINNTYVWKHGVASGRTYVVPRDSEGARFEVYVTVTNAAGSRAYTILTNEVAGVAPVSTRAPSIAGIARVGSTLTAYPGSWSGAVPLVFPYEWQSSPDGLVWTSLVRSGSRYTVPLAFAGFRLRVVVTVSNGAGSATGISAATDPIAAAPALLGAPTLTVARPVAGGSVVTATPGAWGAHPTCTYADRWESSTDAAHWVPITGAVTDRLTLVTSLLGGYVRVVVTATNSAGSATATSVALAAR